jgi:hypothetical protein
MRLGPLTIAAVGVLLSPIVVPAAGTVDFPIVIRTYDASGLPEADRTAAMIAATAILEDAGLTIRRLACDQVTSAAGGHACMAPLRAHELSLRLVRLPASDRGGDPVTLAYSMVDGPVRFGALATVYVDRVIDLAAVARVEVPTLLGRTIAHEIGHLLLGTAAHAAVGVMRASWSPDALRHSTANDWRFTPADAEALRAAARRRTGDRKVPGGRKASGYHATW